MGAGPLVVRKVRYSGEAKPIFVGVCHCSNCQKGSGTAFNTVITVPKAGISTNGKAMAERAGAEYEAIPSLSTQ